MLIRFLRFERETRLKKLTADVEGTKKVTAKLGFFFDFSVGLIPPAASPSRRGVLSAQGEERECSLGVKERQVGSSKRVDVVLSEMEVAVKVEKINEGEGEGSMNQEVSSSLQKTTMNQQPKKLWVQVAQRHVFLNKNLKSQK